MSIYRERKKQKEFREKHKRHVLEWLRILGYLEQRKRDAEKKEERPA